MLSRVKRRTLHVWIACLAILFAALAPSISHALAAASPSRFEICSADGGKTAITGGVLLKKAGAGATHHLEHCPYCATHAGSFAMPPGVVAGFAVVGGHDLFPRLYYTAPAPLFSWSAARPRGPPAAA
jgi:hypothetical protein